MPTVNRLYSFSSFFQLDFPLFVKEYIHTNKDCPKSIISIRDFWKIVYIVQGHGAMIINQEEFPIKKGSLLIVHPDDLTALNIQTKQIDIYNILFLPELIANGINEFSSEFSFYSIFQKDFQVSINRKLREQLYVLASNRDITSLIRRMAKEYQAKPANYQIVLKSQLIELLALVGRLSKNKIKHSDKGLIDYLQNFIDKNYMHIIDFGELAKNIGFSHSHMCRLFKSKTGITISELLRQKRLSAACNLLKKSDFTISEICYTCGFNDLSHFYKTFKNEYGDSPGKYKKKYGTF